MRIVSLEEFIRLPIGTIYSHFQPCIVEGLYRKGESISDADFFYSSIQAECHNDDPPIVDAIQSRWGRFDYDALFAVYEPADISLMKEMLG